MPGTNAGTGSPISFRCSACRRLASRSKEPVFRPRRGCVGGTYWRETYHGGRRDRVALTGRTRNFGTRGARMSATAREYRCLDCGHVGWSRHVDLGRA